MAIYAKRPLKEFAMATMNVSLPDPMRDWVVAQIDSGLYASVSDYVRDLIRKDQTRSTEQQQWLAALDAAVVRSIADGEAGRLVPAEQVFDRLADKYAAMAAARGQPC